MNVRWPERRWMHGVLVVWLVAAGGSAWAASDLAHEPALYWWRGGFGEDFQTHDVVEWVAASRVGDSAFVYEHPVLAVYAAIGHERADGSRSPFQYNLRAPACFLATLIDRALGGGAGFGGKVEPRWWTYLLLVHNNTYKLRVTPRLRLTLTTRTDVPFVNEEKPDRGLLFTPRVGVEWVAPSPGLEHEDPPFTNRLHVGVGHASWWGFDGQRRDEGWTFVVGFAFLAAI